MIKSRELFYRVIIYIVKIFKNCLQQGTVTFSETGNIASLQTKIQRFIGKLRYQNTYIHCTTVQRKIDLPCSDE